MSFPESSSRPSTQSFPGLKKGGETDRSQQNFLLQWVTSGRTSPSGKEPQGIIRGFRVLLQGCGPPANGGKQLEVWGAVPGRTESQGRALTSELGRKLRQEAGRPGCGRACHCCSQCPGMTVAEDRLQPLRLSLTSFIESQGNSILSMCLHTTRFSCVCNSRGNFPMPKG